MPSTMAISFAIYPLAFGGMLCILSLPKQAQSPSSERQGTDLRTGWEWYPDVLIAVYGADPVLLLYLSASAEGPAD